MEDHGENFELHQRNSLEAMDNVDFHQPKQFGENYTYNRWIYSGTLQFDPYNWGLCFRKNGTNGSETVGI